MPSKEIGQSDDEKSKNLTLRLPEEYHRQLVAQSGRRGLTLNALLNNIVHRHLLESGYAPDVIKSNSGRLFEVKVEPVSDRLADYFCCRFDIFENHLLYNKRRAYYLIALSEHFAEQENDPYGLVKDVGIAMLNFYNRKGLEIDQLAWQTSPNHPASPSPTMKDNWRYIDTSITENVGEFLIALARNHWKDDLVASTGQSQDIRCKLRSEADLYK